MCPLRTVVQVKLWSVLVCSSQWTQQASRNALAAPPASVEPKAGNTSELVSAFVSAAIIEKWAEWLRPPPPLQLHVRLQQSLRRPLPLLLSPLRPVSRQTRNSYFHRSCCTTHQPCCPTAGLCEYRGSAISTRRGAIGSITLQTAISLTLLLLADLSMLPCCSLIRLSLHTPLQHAPSDAAMGAQAAGSLSSHPSTRKHRLPSRGHRRATSRSS